MRSPAVIIGIGLMLLIGCTPGSADDIVRFGYVPDPSAPDNTVKICFIHHSTGSAWIATGNGNLGTELNGNGYYVVECDYGWDYSSGDDNIGSSTDTEDWPDWFNDTVMPSVYANDAHYDYTNDISDPGGDVEIVMFKSCYPNSEVGDSIADEKAIYDDLLDYFDDHTDKMFVLVIPPPEIVIDSAPLTRELSRWLVDRDNGWLSGYAHGNVYAFDYYNVLTDPKNHHRIDASGRETDVVSGSPADAVHPDELYYPTGDSHPSSEGHQKAAEEFVPLLNAWYHLWQGS